MRQKVGWSTGNVVRGPSIHLQFPLGELQTTGGSYTNTPPVFVRLPAPITFNLRLCRVGPSLHAAARFTPKPSSAGNRNTLACKVGKPIQVWVYMKRFNFLLHASCLAQNFNNLESCLQLRWCLKIRAAALEGVLELPGDLTVRCFEFRCQFLLDLNAGVGDIADSGLPLCLMSCWDPESNMQV